MAVKAPANHTSNRKIQAYTTSSHHFPRPPTLKPQILLLDQALLDLSSHHRHRIRIDPHALNQNPKFVSPLAPLTLHELEVVGPMHHRMSLLPHPVLHLVTVSLMGQIAVHIRLSNQLPPILRFPDDEENGIMLMPSEVPEEGMMAIGPCFMPAGDDTAVGFREGVVVRMPI